MLRLSAEDWARLHAFGPAQRMLAQIDVEIKALQDMIGDGTVLSGDVGETAVMYALNCGQIRALKLIRDYEPLPDQPAGEGK